MRYKLLFVLLSVLLVVPAAALVRAQDGERGIGDPLFPLLGNPGYDVQHYTLDLAVDVDANTLAGTVTVEAQMTADRDTLSLDFSGMTVDAVTLDGAQVTFSREPHELVITAPATLQTGDAVTLAVTYHGTPGAGLSEQEAAFNSGWDWRGDSVVVHSEPAGAAAWYPVNDHPADKASYTFRITVPERYTVAANGVLTETHVADAEGDTHVTYVWEARAPVASYLVTLAVGDFERLTQDGPGGVIVRHYLAPAFAGDPPAPLLRTPDMLAFFADRFGAYPFDAYGVLVTDSGVLGLEAQTLTLIGGGMFDESVTERFVPPDLSHEALLAHELAHQWFGDSVSLVTWGETWLKEGFAVYGSWLWLAEAHDAALLDRIARDAYSEIASGGGLVRGATPFDDLTGAAFLYLLESVDGGDLPVDEVAGRLFDPQALPAALEALPDDLRALELPVDGRLPRGALRVLLENHDGDTITGADALAMLEALPVAELSGRDMLEAFALILSYNARGDAAFNIFAPPGQTSGDLLLHPGVYYRGALALYALHQRVGDAVFFDILRAYQERYRHANAATADFVTVAEEVSGESLVSFFDAWLFDETLPDIPEKDLAGS